MGIFNRLFKVAQSEAHSVVEKLEDPIKMTEQGIRDLKDNLREAMMGLAQVKSVAIRLKKDADDQSKRAASYERKAMMLLQSMQSGDMAEADAERLATQALQEKEEAAQRAGSIQADYEVQQKASDQLQAKVGKMRRDIQRYENELVTLRARAKTATSMRKINQHLAGVDSSSTVAMLEKMKNKVMEQETLAHAYGDIVDESKSLDDEIAGALEGSSTAASDSLAEMKRRMGIEG